MPKVTYHAPAGDSEVVTTGGVRFFDGRPEDLDADEHAALLGKLSTNPHFDVDGPVSADDETTDDDPSEIGLRAIHRGRGKYSIVRGDKDEEVKDGLTKADADAFNALSDEDREAYVA